MSRKINVYDPTMKQYARYEATYKALRDAGQVKRGTRKLGINQFREFIDEQRTEEGLSAEAATSQLIEAQNKFGQADETLITQAFNRYVELSNQTETHTYFGSYGRGDAEHRVYQDINTFKKNISAHQFIALMASMGSREEALELYGY